MVGNSNNGDVRARDRRPGRTAKATRLVGVLAALGLLAAACGSSSSTSSTASPGVTANSILFGQTVPKSGPAALYGQQALGIQAYFDTINAQGGVNGRKLKLTSLDDQYSPPVALQDTKTLIEQDHVFAIVETNGTATTEASMPIYQQFGVPVVGVGSGASFSYEPLRPFFFNIWPRYTLEGKALGQYATQTIKSSKIGVIYQNDDFGKTLYQGFQNSGATAAVSIPYDPTQTDFSSAVAQLKSAGVDAVIILAIPGPAISIMNAMAAINFHPKILLSQVSITPSSYSAVNSTEINNSYISAFIPPLTTDSTNPQVAAFLSAMQKYEPSIPAASVFAAWGWEAAQTAVAGLKATKGPLTRASFIAGMNTLTNLPILGGTISYSPTDHSGLKTITVLENINGQRVKPTA
jgi:ABC-type branched-subunit amino acid transport system substrate-binding protein